MVPVEEYPYAVRVTAEIMESNGSTSMASICGATLALMDAGVPLKRPVAGISIGICTEYGSDDAISRYQLLTDIIGWEDAFCDMDCKIAGTEKGITGFQLDLKLKGLPLSIMAEAVQKAYTARLEILKHMAETISEPRTEVSKYAPRITVMRINPEKIGMLIGPGGKNIKRLVDESGCEIDIEDDGTVKIFSVSAEGMEIAKKEIEAIGAEIEIGRIYLGRVVTLKEFGAFVEVLPGQDGLVHVSELSNKRVNRPEDVIKVGDEIWVKCIGVDDKGRVKLSRKAAMEERGEIPPSDDSEPAAKAERPERPQRGGRGERGERRERAPRGEASSGEAGGETEGSSRPARGPKQGSPEDKARAAAAAEPGKIYRAKVVSIKDFGAFVEFAPGAEGLVHVSELANFRVKKVEDIVQMGDEITVKCLGIDEKGRVRLSRKAAMEEREQQPEGSTADSAEESTSQASPAEGSDPSSPPTNEG